MIFGGFFRDSITVLLDRHPAMSQLAIDWHGPVAFALHAFTGPVVWLAFGGVALAWFFYLKRPSIPAAIKRRFSGVYRLLDNKYYMDWFNEHVLARGARAIGTGLWKRGDMGLIDGVLIDGSARGIGSIARLARRLQSGYLYWYALFMIVGVIGLMTWQLWPFLGQPFGR
jgi:NADH-quinone oxidoreductase subunit L